MGRRGKKHTAGVRGKQSTVNKKNQTVNTEKSTTVNNRKAKDNGAKLIFDDPILPIIYYEGKSKWTAAKNFKDRVYFSDTLAKYIPDFEYIVVPISQYTNQEIIDRQDELSLLMLINKLKSSEDFENLKEIPPEYFENLEANTPEYLLKLISKIVAVFLYRLNVPREEVENFTDQIERREISMLFDSFEAYDVQEIRRIRRRPVCDTGNQPNCQSPCPGIRHRGNLSGIRKKLHNIIKR